MKARAAACERVPSVPRSRLPCLDGYRPRCYLDFRRLVPFCVALLRNAAGGEFFIAARQEDAIEIQMEGPPCRSPCMHSAMVLSWRGRNVAMTSAGRACITTLALAGAVLPACAGGATNSAG